MNFFAKNLHNNLFVSIFANPKAVIALSFLTSLLTSLLQIDGRFQVKEIFVSHKKLE